MCSCRAREHTDPRPLQPARRVARPDLRPGLPRSVQCAVQLCPLTVPQIDHVRMVRRAAYPPGEADEPVANGRTAQDVADAEKQRGAEESHGMPFLSIASWGWVMGGGMGRRCAGLSLGLDHGWERSWCRNMSAAHARRRACPWRRTTTQVDWLLSPTPRDTFRLTGQWPCHRGPGQRLTGYAAG